eukprot:SAG31_NODE_275_length_18666_cov_8.489309_9_plen_314_part_00
MHSDDNAQRRHYLEARLSGEMKRSEPDPQSVASGFYAVPRAQPVEDAAGRRNASPRQLPMTSATTAASGAGLLISENSWSADASPPPTSISKKRKVGSSGGNCSTSPGQDLQRGLDFHGAFGSGESKLATGSEESNALQWHQHQQQLLQQQQKQHALELQAIQSELEEARRDKQKLESHLRQCQTDAKRREQSVEQWKQRYQDERARQQLLHERASSFSSKLLTEQCLVGRSEASLQLQKNCHEIGSIKVQRQGASLTEAWEEGAAFRALRQRSDRIAEEREEYEKLQRQVRHPGLFAMRWIEDVACPWCAWC